MGCQRPFLFADKNCLSRLNIFSKMVPSVSANAQFNRIRLADVQSENILPTRYQAFGVNFSVHTFWFNDTSADHRDGGLLIREYYNPPSGTGEQDLSLQRKNQKHTPFFGHGAMPGTKKMPDLELILKVVMPSDPTFHFKNYVYIRLIVTKLGILKGVTSHSHTITNIHCKCSFNMYKL